LVHRRDNSAGVDVAVFYLAMLIDGKFLSEHFFLRLHDVLGIFQQLSKFRS
jgi:hypothetical protein